MSIGPNLVFNCGCGHKPAPFGSNEVCQYNIPVMCGGPTHCPICRGNMPPAVIDPPPMPLASSNPGAGTWRGIDVDAVENDEADSGKPQESEE